MQEEPTIPEIDTGESSCDADKGDDDIQTDGEPSLYSFEDHVGAGVTVLQPVVSLFVHLYLKIIQSIS